MKLGYLRVVERSWDQRRGGLCWTPPAPPCSCPTSQLLHSSQRQPLFPLAPHFCFCMLDLVNEAPQSSCCSFMLWWIMKADCGWRDGLMASHSDRAFREQHQHVNQQKPQPAFTKKKNARPAAAHSDSSLCFDVSVWLFPAPGKMSCCLQFCSVFCSARVELACMWRRQDFDVRALGFAR